MAPVDATRVPQLPSAKRLQRSAPSVDEPKANAAMTALRKEYPFIDRAASAYVDALLPALGLEGADRDRTMLVRFNKPSAQEKATIRANGKLRIASAQDIAGQRSLAQVLTQGFGQYDRTNMGAARGEFGVYTQAQIAQGAPLATGDAAAVAAYRASHPAAAGDQLVPSRIDSARLYKKAEAAWQSGPRFSQAYQEQLRHYWDQHQAPLAELQRRIALDMTTEASASDAIDNRDIDLAVFGLGGQPKDHVKVYALDVAGQRSHNALRIEDSDSGRNLLYLPGARHPLRGFDDAQAARQWIDGKAANSGWARRFVQRHFTFSPTAGELSHRLESRTKQRQAGSTQATPLLSSDSPLGTTPFETLTKWQREQELDLMRAAVDDGGDVAAVQKAQGMAWQVLEKAQAAQRQGLAAVEAPGMAGAEATSAAAPLTRSSALERQLEQIAAQQPDLQSSAAQYASGYLRKHFGVELDPANTYLASFLPPKTTWETRLRNIADLSIAGGLGAAVLDLLPQGLDGASSLPKLPPQQVIQRTPIDELFIRNFNSADGKLVNRKGATAFGVFTAADFNKKHLTVDTWRQIEQKSRQDGTENGVRNPFLAASRIDAQALYRQMMLPAAKGGNDLANVYRQQVADFWDKHGSALAGLHRQAAMARLDESLGAGKLNESEHAFFRQGLENVEGGGVRTDALRMDGRTSHNGLYLFDKSGSRQGLYLPGEQQPFKVFADRGKLEAWFNQRAKDGAWVDRFARDHFSATDANGLDGGTGVATFFKTEFLQVIPSTAGVLYPKALSRSERIEGDPFDFLSGTMREKALEDADWQVNSNDEYQKQRTIQRFQDVPVGGSLVKAILGRGSQRAEGELELVGDAINAASLLVPGGAEARAAEETGAAVEAAEQATSDAAIEQAGTMRGATSGTAMPRSTEPVGRDQLDYRVAPAVDHDVSLAGRVPGANQVYTIADKSYIALDGHAVRIQGLADQGRRAIVADQSGQALHGVQVLRSDDGWQVGALRGGAPTGPRLIPRGKPGTQANYLPGPAFVSVPMTPLPAVDELYGMRLTPQERELAWNGPKTAEERSLAATLNARGAAKTRVLLTDANSYFSRLPVAQESMFELPAGTAPNQTLPGESAGAPTVLSGATDKQILSSVYQRHDGFFIGENHGETAVNSFLKTNMANLKANGVETIYMELSGDIIGEEIEKFNRGRFMSPQLRHYLTENLRESTDSPGGVVEIFEQAGRHGIAIKPIDTYAASRLKVDISGDRLKAMNYYALRKIEEDQRAHPGKWLAVVGGSHLDKTSTLGIPSLGTLLGVPSMKVRTAPPKLGRIFITDYGDRVVDNGKFLYTRTSDWRLMLPQHQARPVAS
ncbi:membrane-targeted effector domain-containing toxin [Herbaspirillum sp. YR522]|uniref:membrane-targeted effector domain-containing toxin n=1 Tax=Herbaspirillum sp. YR522 TaxID=1144342 RepID=UPI00031B2D82|nr:membrane-targeted effector domain-containing toxin [Herbaspirillum sp. YR522]